MHQVHRAMIRVGKQRFVMDILFSAVRLLTEDESGKSAVAYLRGAGLSESDEDRYFREAEARAWHEKP